jgi:hypothetical protein
MRNLTISDSKNLKGCKEFNHLRITNIEEFFYYYSNNLDYYAPPFKILAELENKILFENNPEKCIIIPYKEFGDIIFDFEGIRLSGDLRIVMYRFSGSLS